MLDILHFRLKPPDFVFMMETFDRSRVAHLLRNPNPILGQAIDDAAKQFWTKNGGEFGTIDSWREARRVFRAQSGNIPIILRGGGRGSMFTAGHLLKEIPNAHVVIYDDDQVLGGMALRAISSFIPGHIPAKEAALRDGMKLMMNPRVDVVPNTTLSDDEFRDKVRRYRLPVAVDGSGTRPVRGDYPYGERVWDIMDLVSNINRPYDEDGHMKRVRLPSAFLKTGERLPIVSVIGGNTGRDAHVAFGLVETVQDIAKVYGMDVEEIDAAKILEHGIAKTRRELGLSALHDLYLYRRPIGEMAGVKKLFQRTAKLERGSLELKQILEDGILGPNGWQERDGGRFIGRAELSRVADTGTSLDAFILNDSPEFDQPQKASLALISIGFEKGQPFRVETPEGVVGTDVGIKVNGGGDLPSTALSAKAIIPEMLIHIASADHSYPKVLYSEFLSDLDADRKKSGMVQPDGADTDPVTLSLRRGPRHLVDHSFIGFVPSDH